MATDEIMTNLQLKIQRLARIENNSKANAAMNNQNDAEHDKSNLDEESSNEQKRGGKGTSGHNSDLNSLASVEEDEDDDCSLSFVSSLGSEAEADSSDEDGSQ